MAQRKWDRGGAGVVWLGDNDTVTTFTTMTAMTTLGDAGSILAADIEKGASSSNKEAGSGSGD